MGHEQNMEYEAFPPEQHAAGGPIASSPRISMRTGRNRSPGREDSDDDEAYFESLDEDEVDEVAAIGQCLSSHGDIATEILPPPSSESPPSAQDVDAAAAGESIPESPEITESAGALEAAEETVAVDAGIDALSSGDPTADSSLQRPSASESPPRSPGDDSEGIAATVANDVPNHAPKRLKTSASAGGSTA